MTTLKVLGHTGPLEFGVTYLDKDKDQARQLVAVRTANSNIVIEHRLGRIPNRVFIDWKAGGPNDVWLSLDTSGRVQADEEKIVVQFAATGNAVVCVS